MVGIYKITSPTGKVYIGQSISIETRASKYRNAKCKSQTKLYNSILKHGWENHLFEIIHVLPKDTSRDTLDAYEQVYINAYKDCGVLFLNIREGGYTGRLNAQSKVKMSEARKGEKNVMYGKKHTTETRLRISQNITGKQAGERNPMYGKKGPLSPNYGRVGKRGIDSPLYGRKHSPESIAKMKSIQQGNKVVGPNHPRFGVKFSDEHKSKISSSLKGHTGNNNKMVIQYSKVGGIVHCFDSIAIASRTLLIQSTDINKCCRGVIKSAGGFIWKYKNESK